MKPPKGFREELHPLATLVRDDYSAASPQPTCVGSVGCNIVGAWRSGSTAVAVFESSRSNLKTPIHGFQAAKRIQELEIGLPDVRRWLCKMLGVLDRESDSFNCDSNLVSRLKVDGRRMVAAVRSNSRQNLIRFTRWHAEVLMPVGASLIVRWTSSITKNTS